jgi:hypothetical protein
MPLRDKLRIDDRFSWAFTGVLVAVAFGIAGLYTALRENRPNLVVEIENQADVLDVHRPLEDLKLSFRGQDIQQQNLNLRIFTVRVSNKGREDVLQGQYDQESPWGIKVSVGQIIEARLATNNSTYLASRIQPEITSTDTITLKKVIFERDRFVTLEMLVLHHKGSPPRILAFGKIAGQDEIAVVDQSGQRGRQGFWSQVISGNLWVHGIRFGGYVVFLIALSLAVAGCFIIVSDIQEFTRKRRIRSVLIRMEGNDEKIVSVLKQTYIEQGPDGLVGLRKALKDDRRLKKGLSRLKRSENEDSETGPPEEMGLELASVHEDPYRSGIHPEPIRSSDDYVVISPGGERYVRVGLPAAILKLAKEGFVKLQAEGKVEVDPSVQETLDEFERQLG